MKFKTGHRVIMLLITLVATAILMWLLQCLLVPKYQKGIVEGGMMAEYYDDLDVPHEVLFLGDCEVYEDISTVELYREYGISSYIRGSAQQLVWQSYYILEDTLQYETPEVVVFNVYALAYNEPQSDSYNHMTLDGLRWSGVKWDAVQASMTEDEKMTDYLFPLLYYHTRWSDLKQTDYEHMFTKDPVTINGYYLRADVRPQGEFPEPKMLTDPNLGKNAMLWLNKIANLCEENGIDLVLVKAPTEYPHWYDEWDQQVSDFAASRDIPYTNYITIRDDIGIDMSTDTYDGGLHLNVYGAEKYADALGQFLVENYSLTDYRTVPDIASLWDNKAAAYDALIQSQLDEIEQYGELQSWGIGAVED